MRVCVYSVLDVGVREIGYISNSVEEVHASSKCIKEGVLLSTVISDNRRKMFCTKLIRQLKLPKIRQLCTPASGSKPTPNNPTPKPTAPESADHSVIGSPMHTCSKLDKRILVWVKRYPSIDKVPDQVTADCILKAHSKGRIRACNIMIVFTVLAFIITIMLGKRDAAMGKHMIPERIKWYNAQREKGKAEEAAAAAAAEKS